MTNVSNPFGETSCEAEIERWQQNGYPGHHFEQVPFNAAGLDPKIYVIVGRRGAGKTSMAHYMTFQKTIENADCIDVDEPETFDRVIQAISRIGLADELDAMHASIRRLWEYAIWAIVFERLRPYSPRIRSLAIARKGRHGVALVLRYLATVFGRSIDDPAKLVAETEALLLSDAAKAAQEECLRVVADRPLLVAFDSLEQYPATNEAFMHCLGALVRVTAEFNRRYSSRGLHVKLFLAAEAYPRLLSYYIRNPLKEVVRPNPLHLNWRPRDLIRLVCWRFSLHLQASGHRLLAGVVKDWEDFDEVEAKLWIPYFGHSLRNRYDRPEKTFPYVLRHTQLRPRQLVVLCNEIARQAAEAGSFPRMADHVRQGVRAAVGDLAVGTVNSYSRIYPGAADILGALNGLPMGFWGSELDRVGSRSASAWPEKSYSTLSFRRFVAELGVVGRARTESEPAEAEILGADFEYAQQKPLVLSVDDYCVIHPVFYDYLDIRREQRLTVYPFPAAVDAP